MPKAYSYIRFSTPDQARGDSFRRQKQLAEDFCTSHGLELASSKEYTFLDRGRSAYKSEHVTDEGELKRFLDLVDNGDIKRGSYLLVESMDRLSRERVNIALERFLGMINKGINICTLADKKIYSSNSDNISLELIASIAYMMKAYSESSEKGFRVSKAWEEKKKNARQKLLPLGKACPQWLELVEGKYTPIPSRVKIIERIFSLCTNEGRGKRAICKILNSESIPAFGSINRNKSGTWSDSSIHKILHNRAVIGEYQPTKLLNGRRVNDGDAIKNYYPEIISESEFYKAASVQKQRLKYKTTKQSKTFNLWQGIGKCDLCASSMNLINKGSGPKGYSYIGCAGLRKGTCNSKYLRLEKADLAFREVLAKVNSEALIYESKNKKLSSLEEAHAQRDKEHNHLEEWKKMLSDAPSKSLAERICELEIIIEELDRKIESLTVEISSTGVKNKDAFFKSIDLESYEGRFKANSLLKRLGLIIKIGQLKLPGGYRWFFTVSSEESDEFEFMIEISTDDFISWGFHTWDIDMASLALEQSDMTAEQLNNAKAMTELQNMTYKLAKTETK
ncbi:recombinase family protein [Pseudomonas sp. WN033]|nr:recombinase family protein [Pseudomonas sp. WN033]